MQNPKMVIFLPKRVFAERQFYSILIVYSNFAGKRDLWNKILILNQRKIWMKVLAKPASTVLEFYST